MNPLLAWVGTAVAVIVAYYLSFAIYSEFQSNYCGSRIGLGCYPVADICIGIAFLIQWIAFVIAFAKKSERFFDAIGAVTFVVVTWLAFALAGQFDIGRTLIALAITCWAVRLGTFLSLRMKKEKTDRRFNQIRGSFSVFFMTWTLQGFWVVISLAPSLVLLTSIRPIELSGLYWLGLVLFILGFAIEIVADKQKKEFRDKPENSNRFISTGLWAWSQHPNYFGEILLWFGLALSAWPQLYGSQYFTLISPLFVFLLLTRISGIRMLDATAKRRWGDDAEYQQYIENTPKLFLRPWKKAT